MKVRKLRKLLNDTNYIIQETDGKICIGSAYIHNIITIYKDTLKIKADDIRGFEELNRIYEKCKELIENGEMRDIANGNDDITDMQPVFIFDSWEGVICSYTDNMEWPNTDHTGRLLYENTSFKTRKEAVKYGIKEMKYILERDVKQLEDKIRDLDRLNSRIKGASELLTQLIEEQNND